MEDYSAYAKHYSEGGFWGAIRKNADKIPFLRDALGMFYCLKDPETPLWVKGLIVGALGYFILPLDVVPDFLPVLGWLDDAGVIAGVLATIRGQVREKHWLEADEWINGGPVVKINREAAVS